MTVTRASDLAAASRTDLGRVRTNNEDLPLCDPDRGVFAVIDGVGGQASGEVAAAIARTEILARLARPLGTPAERVREAIALANNEIFRQAEQSGTHHGMTCVLTLALVVDRRITIGHVGDSRLYKLAPGGIRKLTHDHSPVGEREDAREMTESEAMRHPRRHEVFRDVGSDYRDKDDEGFVEIVEGTLEPDNAILLCSDGLTDMVASSTIEELVRQHAGDPEAVTEALIEAANEAGGKDNITVVYAEAPEFARAMRGERGASRAVTEPVVTTPGAGASLAPIHRQTAPEPGAAPGGLARAWHWVISCRATWFACGTAVGIAAALVLVWRLGGATPERGRTLVVGSSAAQSFARIADAMASARAGDVVQLEPGIYDEQVVVPDGVDLVARLVGRATLVRARGAAGEWRAVTAAGASGGRIYGIRIESKVEAPIDVGVRISGAGRRIELVDIDGPMRASLELIDATAVTVRGGLVRTVQGPAVMMDAKSEATIANNTFVRTGRTGEPALSLKDAARTVLIRNLFAGYGNEIIRGVSPNERAQLLSGSFIVASEPAVAR